MTDQEKIDTLLAALAALLRQTADPDPLHPAFQDARKQATEAYHAIAPAF